MLTTMPMGWFPTYLGFGLFAGITFGVLLMMDVLECFLHFTTDSVDLSLLNPPY